MDAKLKADFINSIRPGGKDAPAPRYCTECGAQLLPGAMFCTKCGKKMEAPAEAAAQPTEPVKAEEPAIKPTEPVKAEEPAIKPAEPVKAEEPAIKPIAPLQAGEAKESKVSEAPAAAVTPVVPAVKEDRYEEQPSAFAEGLPEWDIEPPQVVVRRRLRR